RRSTPCRPDRPQIRKRRRASARSACWFASTSRASVAPALAPVHAASRRAVWREILPKQAAAADPMMRDDISPLGLRGIVLLIAVSVAMWVGIEQAVRIYLLQPMYGPLLAEMRAHYFPALTPEIMAARATRIAWVLLAVTVVAGIVGVALLRSVVARGGQSAT